MMNQNKEKLQKLIDRATLRRSVSNDRMSKRENNLINQVQKRSVLVTSKLYGYFKPGGMLLTFEIAVPVMFLRFYIADLTGIPTTLKIKNSAWTYDPSVDHYAPVLFFLPLSIVFVHLLIYKVIIPIKAKSSYQKEVLYLETLPFKVEKYFEIIGAKDFSNFNIEIIWNKTKPGTDYLNELVDGIDVKYKLSLIETNHRTSSLRFLIKTLSSKNGFRAINSFHEINRELLIPLHSEFPITKIVFS